MRNEDGRWLTPQGQYSGKRNLLVLLDSLKVSKKLLASLRETSMPAHLSTLKAHLANGWRYPWSQLWRDWWYIPTWYYFLPVQLLGLQNVTYIILEHQACMHASGIMHASSCIIMMMHDVDDASWCNILKMHHHDDTWWCMHDAWCMHACLQTCMETNERTNHPYALLSEMCSFSWKIGMLNKVLPVIQYMHYA